MAAIYATIRTRIPKRELVKLFRQLPGILSGSRPDRYNVGQSFRVSVGMSMLKQIHRSYITKARGENDSLALGWKPLAPSTIKQKKRLGLSDYRARLINRRTDRLLNSLKPAEINYYHYRPPKDQVFRVQRKAVVVGSSVPYAKFVHAKRRLWPSMYKMRGWLRRAVVAGRDMVVLTLQKRAGG